MSTEDEKTYTRPTQIVHYGVAEISKTNEDVKDVTEESEANLVEMAETKRTVSPTTPSTVNGFYT